MLEMNEPTKALAAPHRSETTDRKNTMGMAQKRTSTCVNDQPRRADPAADNRLMSELLGLGLRAITVDPGGQNASATHRGLTSLFQPRGGTGAIRTSAPRRISSMHTPCQRSPVEVTNRQSSP